MQTTKVKREKSFVVYWISSKCRENFRGFALSVLKVLPLLETFIGKTFMIHHKSAKTALLRTAFVIYGMYVRIRM